MSIEDKGGRPWSAMFGLLTGFGVAVICIYRDINPDVILFRAVVSGLICGFAVSFTRIVVRLFQS